MGLKWAEAPPSPKGFSDEKNTLNEIYSLMKKMTLNEKNDS